MGWLTSTTDSETTQEDRWLKFEELKKSGESSKVTLRILDSEPEGVWRHWIGQRPYNCPGLKVCPVCTERKRAQMKSPDTYREEFKMDHRYYFNVLVNGEVKILSFGQGIGKQLIRFNEAYETLQGYDITIVKTKTGPTPMNVEYSVLRGKDNPLTPDEEALDRYDLTEFTTPATIDVLQAALRGEEAPSAEAENDPQAAKQSELIMLEALAKSRGIELNQLLTPGEKPTSALVQDLIKTLSEQ